jgi:NAD-dependent deacetylase
MGANPDVAAAAKVLSQSKSVVVFTGAGISAESGLATYRSGDNALWSAEKFEKYANPRGYRANIPESYEWYRQRALAAAAAMPNAGHLAIVSMAAHVPELTVVTQNVDGLHVRAGSTDVVELHGNLREARCDACGSRIPWAQTSRDPMCAECGGMLRPDVVMFEEMLSEPVLKRAREAAERCDLLISVGTSNVVWPARELPMVAHRTGAWVFIVNTDLSGQPEGDRILHLQGKAGEVLPEVEKRAR